MGSVGLYLRPLKIALTLTPEESLHGFVCRLARANGLFPQDLAQLLGMRNEAWPCLVTRPHWTTSLAIITGLTKREVRVRQILPRADNPNLVEFLGDTVPRTDIEFARRRIIPTELQREKTHRAVWLRKNYICSDEGEPVIDRCRCGTVQTWAGAVELDTCSGCGIAL